MRGEFLHKQEEQAYCTTNATAVAVGAVVSGQSNYSLIDLRSQQSRLLATDQEMPEQSCKKNALTALCEIFFMCIHNVLCSICGLNILKYIYLVITAPSLI